MDRSKKASSSDRPSAAAGNQGDQSNHRTATDGWGSRSTFQHSYILPPTPEGFTEGNQILEAFREHDRRMDAEGAEEAAQAEKGGE